MFFCTPTSIEMNVADQFGQVKIYEKNGIVHTCCHNSIDIVDVRDKQGIYDISIGFDDASNFFTIV